METKTVQSNTITGTTKTNDWGSMHSFICPHLLPCGLCDRTDRPYPRSNGTYDPWTPHWVYTNKNISFDNGVNSVTTECDKHE